MKKRPGSDSSCFSLFAIIFISAFFPAADASSVEAPKSVYIDKGACPFECCRYGSWTVRKTTTAHISPDTFSDRAGEYQSGAKVTALSGEVHTVPGRFIVKKAHARYTPGDTILVLTYLGEGHFKIWFNERMYVEDLNFSPAGGSTGKRCEVGRYCWGELTGKLKSSWWIKIKNADGWIGWTNQGENFDGKDACS